MLIKKYIFLILEIIAVLVLGKNISTITNINNHFFAFIIFILYITIYIALIELFKRIIFYISGTKIKFNKIYKQDAILIAETYIVQMFGGIAVNTLGIFFVGHLQETNQDNIRNFLSNLSPGLLIMAVILTVFIVPVMEEIVFRGYMMNAFFKNNSYYSIAFSSFLFAYLHMHSLFLTTDNIFVFFQYLVLGVSLGFVYHTSKKITVNIGLHMLINAIATLVLLINIY